MSKQVNVQRLDNGENMLYLLGYVLGSPYSSGARFFFFYLIRVSWCISNIDWLLLDFVQHVFCQNMFFVKYVLLQFKLKFKFHVPW